MGMAGTVQAALAIQLTKSYVYDTHYVNTIVPSGVELLALPKKGCANLTVAHNHPFCSCAHLEQVW